jgi:hypothetical protein
MPRGPKGEKRPALDAAKVAEQSGGLRHGWGRLKAALTLNGRTSICGWECAGSPASQTRSQRSLKITAPRWRYTSCSTISAASIRRSSFARDGGGGDRYALEHGPDRGSDRR